MLDGEFLETSWSAQEVCVWEAHLSWVSELVSSIRIVAKDTGMWNSSSQLLKKNYVDGKTDLTWMVTWKQRNGAQLWIREEQGGPESQLAGWGSQWMENLLRAAIKGFLQKSGQGDPIEPGWWWGMRNVIRCGRSSRIEAVFWTNIINCIFQSYEIW